MMTQSVVTKMHSIDFPWVPSENLMRYLTAVPQRPNLLVECSHRAGEAIVASLKAVCAPPVHLLKMPGPLAMPARKAGTLLLQGASMMTLEQQIELNDWLSSGRGELQIVSITNAPLWDLVQEGRFLEGLFYRLNVVYLEGQRRG
jgi:hypothetical protein